MAFQAMNHGLEARATSRRRQTEGSQSFGMEHVLDAPLNNGHSPQRSALSGTVKSLLKNPD